MAVGLCQAEEVKVKSPSGNLEVAVSDEGGKATYQVSLDGKQMVTKSNLGLNTSIGDLTNGLKIIGSKTEVVEKQYRQMRDVTFPMIRRYVGDDYRNMDDEACAGEFYLDSLAVLPEYRRKGIASALLQEMFRLRDEAGIPLATIAVDPENDTAYRLYCQNGFHHDGQVMVFKTTYWRMVCPK